MEETRDNYICYLIYITTYGYWIFYSQSVIDANLKLIFL